MKKHKVFDDENVTCTANGWLEDQEQQFFYNGMRTSEKPWTKRISVAGKYVEKWQNMMCDLVVNCVGLRTLWMPLVHTTVDTLDSLQGIADKWTIVYRISYCTLSVGLDLWSLAESLYLYFHNAYTLSSTKNGQIYDVLFFNVDMLRRKKISEVTLNTCMITWAISSAAEVDSHGIQNTRCINMKYIQQHNHTLM